MSGTVVEPKIWELVGTPSTRIVVGEDTPKTVNVPLSGLNAWYNLDTPDGRDSFYGAIHRMGSKVYYLGTDYSNGKIEVGSPSKLEEIVK